MNSKPVVALPEVATDLRQGMAHYASWRTDGANHFLQKYGETIDWIAWNPDSFPKKYGSVRRAIVKHSYYIVYFVQQSNHSLVLAVLDGRRAPKDIQSVVKRRTPSRRKRIP